MKVYITSRYRNASKDEIEALCQAVRDAGFEDFSFIRDVENYQKVFHDPKDLWERSRDELKKCDALLIDVSDQPSGGRVIEVGMAYALQLPIFVLVKEGTTYKDIYDGVATKIILYKTYQDVTAGLKEFVH